MASCLGNKASYLSRKYYLVFKCQRGWPAYLCCILSSLTLCWDVFCLTTSQYWLIDWSHSQVFSSRAFNFKHDLQNLELRKWSFKFLFLDGKFSTTDCQKNKVVYIAHKIWLAKNFSDESFVICSTIESALGWLGKVCDCVSSVRWCYLMKDWRRLIAPVCPKAPGTNSSTELYGRRMK